MPQPADLPPCHPAPPAYERSPGGLGLPYLFPQVPRAPTAHPSALLPLQPQPPGLSPEVASPQPAGGRPPVTSAVATPAGTARGEALSVSEYHQCLNTLVWRFGGSLFGALGHNQRCSGVTPGDSGTLWYPGYETQTDWVQGKHLAHYIISPAPK